MPPPLLPSTNSPTDDVPKLAPIGAGMGMHDGIPNGVMVSEAGHGPNVTQAPARATTGPLHISTGVSQGMLIAPILPVYPAIAKAAHVEGTVVVEAIISRTAQSKASMSSAGQSCCSAPRSTRSGQRTINLSA
jgi:protein TonB